MSEVNLCAICKVPSSQSCSMCNLIYYCSKEHQKLDWKRHKNTDCAPYKIDTNDILGRHLIAVRDIKPGEFIMCKKPLLLGPKMVSHPLCLGCHKKLNNQNSFYLCSSCKWPMCGAQCEKLEVHRDECKVFKENKYAPKITPEVKKQGNYAIILPLRAFMLKLNSPSKYKDLNTMQTHLEENINSPLYNLILRTIVPVLITVLKVDTSNEEILQICSIFDTNCFDIRDSSGLVVIRGIYPTASFLAHDCTQNTKHSFHGDGTFEMHMRATVPIPRGRLITNTYTQLLWGTMARRAHLRKSKHFDCTCKRCSDPTELGTFLGAVRCSSCMQRKVESMVISTNPLDEDAPWSCERCMLELPGRQIILGNESLKRKIADIVRGDPANFEMFLEEYESMLHPANCHIMEVKYALSQMYGNMDGYRLNELSDGLVIRKVNLCRELLEIAEILQPGESKFRGTLLYDLQAVTVELAKRNYSKGYLTIQQATVILNDSIQILQEAVQILKTEPGMSSILKDRLENIYKEFKQ